jgi:DNA polymerase-3 subunit epsilon
MDLHFERTITSAPHWPDDRRRSAAWAKERLDRADFVILDTETTGLGREDEVIEVGVLAPDGLVLLDVALKPTRLIDPVAERVHGLSRARLSRATTFTNAYEALADVLAGQIVVVYNAEFDERMLDQTCRRYRLPPLTDMSWVQHCAMQWYARFVGEWNFGKGSYKWQRLEGGDHSAIGDCRATLKVLQEMAEEAV